MIPPRPHAAKYSPLYGWIWRFGAAFCKAAAMVDIRAPGADGVYYSEF